MSGTGSLVRWEKQLQALPERCAVCTVRTAVGFVRVNCQDEGTTYAFVCRDCAYGLYDLLQAETP